MKKQILWISAGCLALFIAIRLIPVEPCEFLHYDQEMTEDGALEFCGPEETSFYNLEQIRFPISAEFRPLGPLEVGKPTRFQFSLTSMSGKMFTGADLGVTHTRKIHLMMVDPSLEDYQHIHPEEGDSPGVFEFTMTPKKSGQYRGFMEFVLSQTGRKVLLLNKLEIPGNPNDPKFTDYSNEVALGDFRFQIESTSDQLKTKEPTTFSLKLLSKTEERPSFEPVMGAFAHLVAFDEKRSGFAHLHPLNASIKNQDPKNPDLSFSFNVFDPGNYRLWAQVKLNGEELFIPFNLNVKEG